MKEHSSLGQRRNRTPSLADRSRLPVPTRRRKEKTEKTVGKDGRKSSIWETMRHTLTPSPSVPSSLGVLPAVLYPTKYTVAAFPLTTVLALRLFLPPFPPARTPVCLHQNSLVLARKPDASNLTHSLYPNETRRESTPKPSSSRTSGRWCSLERRTSTGVPNGCECLPLLLLIQRLPRRQQYPRRPPRDQRPQ